MSEERGPQGDMDVAYRAGFEDGEAFGRFHATADRARLREAILIVSVRHDWANTEDTEDRTEEIATAYDALFGVTPTSEPLPSKDRT